MFYDNGMFKGGWHWLWWISLKWMRRALDLHMVSRSIL